MSITKCKASTPGPPGARTGPGAANRNGPPSKLHFDINTTYNRTKQLQFLTGPGAIAPATPPPLSAALLNVYIHWLARSLGRLRIPFCKLTISVLLFLVSYIYIYQYLHIYTYLVPDRILCENFFQHFSD